MQVKELSEKDCRAALQRASMGRLGCSFEDQPYVIPVHIAFDGEAIYVFSTFGQKIKWMRANPKVCVQVDEINAPSKWISVIAYGRFEELPEPRYTKEREHARGLLQERHQWWLNAVAERRVSAQDVAIEPMFFRILIDSVTGLATE